MNIKTPTTGIIKIFSALREFQSQSVDLYIIHSSLFLIKPQKKDLTTIYESLLEVFGKNSTFCFPTFTFQNNNQSEAKWNELSSPGEMGALNEFIRRKEESIRSIHPTHSFALIGPLAKEVTSNIGESAFGADSVLNHMIELGAVNISLGAPFEGGHTFVHTAEELTQVPYRSDVQIKTKCFLKDGTEVKTKFKYFARNICFDKILHENNWSIAWKELVAENLIQFKETKYGLVTYSECKTVVNYLKEVLARDPFAYAKPCYHSHNKKQER